MRSLELTVCDWYNEIDLFTNQNFHLKLQKSSDVINEKDTTWQSVVTQYLFEHNTLDILHNKLVWYTVTDLAVTDNWKYVKSNIS